MRRGKQGWLDFPKLKVKSDLGMELLGPKETSFLLMAAIIFCLHNRCLSINDILTLICRYYHNITSNTLVVLESMARHGVNTLIYSSTCATYGEPEKMPITEETPQVCVNS